jgi:vanillate O-demethylase ferredoxin subunit
MDRETLQVRVAHKRSEAEDIVGFDLVSAYGDRLPSFSAGAHIDVHVPRGPVRRYSLCNSPTQDTRYQIAVLLDPFSRGGSIGMHSNVHEGDVITISRPRNHFPLEGTTGHPLLLAGGIGVTPILCMAEQLARAGAEFEMHYWTRCESRTAFLSRIRASAFAANVRIQHDDSPVLQRVSLHQVFSNRTDARQAYICGPPGFLEAAREAARRSGWPDEQVHFEYFRPRADGTRATGEFEVQIASTGAIYVVPPEKTVLQVLAENAVEVPVSCEQGICGTCITRVLSGEPEHRDMILTPQERARNDQFTPCCSRSRSPRLVLDL